MRIYPCVTVSMVALAALVAGASPAFAENFMRGQELFEHHCHACHGDLRFAEKESKIKDMAELRQRIAGWAAHAGSDWQKGEIDDVLYYMNKSFYHFNGTGS